MNAYLTGIEGMPKLLLELENPLQSFHKKTYEDSFKRAYERNLPTLDAVESGYNLVIDKDQFLTNMAEALAKAAKSEVDKIEKRGKRDQQLVDYNMAMAVYVLPMILEYKGNSTKPLCEKVLAAWKKEFPKSNIQAAEYEVILSGFHKKFCYITTAVCETFHKPDDCYELTLLRGYRDSYLMAQPEGEEMIREYYDVAPSIVKHINKRKDRAEIYRGVWDEYLAPCIQMIEEGENEACQKLYRDMVYTLKERYFRQ